MKNTMMIKQITTILLILLLTSVMIFAQKTKTKPTTESASKTNQTKAITKATLNETTKIDDTVSAENKAKAEDFFKKGQAYWKTFDIQEAVRPIRKGQGQVVGRGQGRPRGQDYR